MKNEIIDLITVQSTPDADGFVQKTETVIPDVFAEIKSATRSEFYQAQHAGISVSLVAVIGIEDFSEAIEKVKYNGRTYKVVRSYIKGKYDAELTLSEVR